MDNQPDESTDPVNTDVGKTNLGAVSKTHASDISRVFRSCEPCFYDEVTETPTGFCVECVEYLCSNCNRSHRKNKLTRGHRILEGEEMPSDPKLFIKIKELMQCPEHHTAEVVYKCEDHDQFICVTCLAVYHRKCESVTELVLCPLDNNLRKRFETLCDTAIANKTFKQKNIERLRFQQQQIEKDRREFLQIVTERLKKLNKTARKKTNKSVKSKCADLEEYVRKCDKLKQKATSFLNLYDSALRYGSYETLTVISSHLQRKAEELEAENTKHSKRDTEIIHFDKNKTLQKVDNIGTVSIVKIPEIESALGSRELSTPTTAEHLK